MDGWRLEQMSNIRSSVTNQRTAIQPARRGRTIFPPLSFTDRRLRGMCHQCFSSNVPIILNEKDGTAVCNDCLEKKERCD